MRIATWNVNSIGARLPRLLDWLQTRAPDVVAVQETKCADSGFPFGPLADLGYQAMHVGAGRWNGVAVLSRVGLVPISRGLPGLTEPRYAVAECGGLQVRCVYVPNGRSLDDPQYPYKLDWLATLRAELDGFDPAQPMVIMGDFNVARTDTDVWDVDAFGGATHVSAPERTGLEALISWGLTDVVARPGKNSVPFTYWDYRAGRFHTDQGMRIDYVLASRGVTVGDAWVDREARKGKLPSDHAPVVAEVTLNG